MDFFLIADLYQINIAYAYWKAGKTDDYAVFDLFFRKNPFQGEFTIFAGLEQCIKFLDSFQYTESGKISISVYFLLQRRMILFLTISRIP